MLFLRGLKTISVAGVMIVFIIAVISDNHPIVDRGYAGPHQTERLHIKDCPSPKKVFNINWGDFTEYSSLTSTTSCNNFGVVLQHYVLLKSFPVYIQIVF